MQIIGDVLNLMNPGVDSIIRARNEDMILSLARGQLRGGAQGLALVFGSCRRRTRDLRWLCGVLRGHLRPRNSAHAPALRELFISAPHMDLAEVLGADTVIYGLHATDPLLARRLDQAAGRQCRAAVFLPSSRSLRGAADGLAQLADQVLETGRRAGLEGKRLILCPVPAPHARQAALRLCRGYPDMDALLDDIAVLREIREQPPCLLVSEGEMYAHMRKNRVRTLAPVLRGLLEEARVDLVCGDATLRAGQPLARAA